MSSWADKADRTVAAGLRAFGGPDETVNYQPAAAAAFDLASGGVFAQAGETIDIGDVEVTTTVPMLGVRLADFPANQPPVAGDRLTRAGITWKVVEVLPDGPGAGARLALHKTV